MLQETNCRIAIRGRGSVKEGRSRKEAKPDPSDNEDLHVLITAEDDESADRVRRQLVALVFLFRNARRLHIETEACSRLACMAQAVRSYGGGSGVSTERLSCDDSLRQLYQCRTCSLSSLCLCACCPACSSRLLL
jgi:hypothetical protein